MFVYNDENRERLFLITDYHQDSSVVFRPVLNDKQINE